MNSPQVMRPVVSREFPCAGGARTLLIFDTPIGNIVTAQVLAGESYPLLPFLAPVRSIVDVGANIGSSAIYFTSQYPDATLLAFEPDPETYSLLSRNTAGIPAVSAFNIGLSDRDEEARLFQGSIDSATNSLGHSDLNTAASISVKLRHAETLLDELAPGAIDILKLDTEGNELVILRALANRLNSIRAIYLEYHDDCGRREIDDLLAATHILVRGSIHFAHRGELCYVRRTDVPGIDMLRIRMPGA